MQRKACMEEGATGGVQEKSALNFAKLTGKLMCPSLSFNNVAGLRPEKELQHRFSPVSFTTFLRIFFLQSTSG